MDKITTPDNLHEGDDQEETFEDELSTQETPVASNPFDDLTAISTVSAFQSNANAPNPFDPFAPQEASVGGGNLLDTFQDETPSNTNTNNNANNTNEIDLLSGMPPTPENTKQATSGSSDWWQLDAIQSPESSNEPPIANADESVNGFEEAVLMGTPANLPEETADQFVNESPHEETTGFFSRMRGLIGTPEQGSGLEPNPATENLEAEGNSLPHPDSLKHGASGDYLQEDNHGENGTVDEENGTFDVPEEPEDLHLDENGLSLPHPETVLPETESIEENEEMHSVSDNASNDPSDSDPSDSDSEDTSDSEDEGSDRESSSESSASGPYLDRHGNSLPHPDEHMVSPSGHAAPTMKWGNLKMSIQSLVSKTSKREDSTTTEIDIETGDAEDSGSDSDSDSASSSDSDSDFNDESNTFTKNNMRTFIEQHKDNPKSRRICYGLLALLLLLLIIVIPASTRKKSKPLDTNSQVATQPPTVIVDIDDTCVDEIVLTDRNGNDLVNGTSTSDDIACFTMDEPIHFRFKRCRPASPLDWVGVFPARSMFMERLWKDHYDGVYLCGDQPCPTNDPLNQKGGPPRSKTLKAPPIKTAGEYRLFLVKDSSWPHEYVDFTPSFRVVDQKSACSDSDNIFGVSKPNFTPVNTDESIYIEASTLVPTAVGTLVSTGFGSISGTNALGFRA